MDLLPDRRNSQGLSLLAMAYCCTSRACAGHTTSVSLTSAALIVDGGLSGSTCLIPLTVTTLRQVVVAWKQAVAHAQISPPKNVFFSLLRKLDALSKFTKILDGPVSILPLAIHFALLGLVLIFANETARPTSGPMPAGDTQAAFE